LPLRDRTLEGLQPLESNGLHYRFDTFLEETRQLIHRAKASLYFQLLFLTPNRWEKIQYLMNSYSLDGRHNWHIRLLKTKQPDFFVLEFSQKEHLDRKHFFYWKVITEEEKITILSFSIEKFRFIQSCLGSFAKYANLERPWFGSSFLENFDDFIHTTYGDTAKLRFERIVYDLEPIARKGKRDTNMSFIEPCDKEAIIKRKKTEFELAKKFLYIRRASVIVNLETSALHLSISDQGEIMFERGDLIIFMELINALKNIAGFYRKTALKHFEISVKEHRLSDGTLAESCLIKNLEVLRINMDNPLSFSWYENLTNLFSQPYYKQEKLMSFVLMKGNPYFLVQIIDLDKGGSGVFLSATEKSIRISPTNSLTKPSTVLKIINTLQKYVDPNITVVGA
jgi:hypothetical protein